MSEIPVVFPCGSDELVGMVHVPEKDECRNVGVLIVVGGPQYRAGSHRQFVTLARDLSRAGIPSMRFDYRGMGDSQGAQISFEETGPDIKAAMDAFMVHYPGLEKVVLWGLCDAASACLIYSVSDDRIKGLVLANPWVRTEAGIAKAYLKHYYSSRFFEKEFWFKILSFDFNYKTSFLSIVRQIRQWVIPKKKAVPFQAKMESAIQRFQGDILFIISGNDMTATEFKDLVHSSKNWKNKIQESHISWQDLEDADHTFSRAQWKAQVSALTINWIQHHYA